MIRFIAPLLILLAFASCDPEINTPKPRGYYHIELPEHAYQKFDNAQYPYHFEYPVYSRVHKDTMFFNEKTENPYWINIDFPEFGGKIYMSYKIIGPGQSYDKLLEDSYELSSVHTKKADYIDNYTFDYPERRVYGVFYNVGGNAASAYQFYVTDSTRHFIRGALYFDVAPNADSLKPVNEFVQADMKHLLETLTWQ